MGTILEQILQKLNAVDENIGALKSDVSTLKSDIAIMKSDMFKHDRKLDAVFEQTGALLEFKTEITEKLNKIIDDNVSLQEIIGEHEIAIRSLRRKAIS